MRILSEFGYNALKIILGAKPNDSSQQIECKDSMTDSTAYFELPVNYTPPFYKSQLNSADFGKKDMIKKHQLLLFLRQALFHSFRGRL